MEIKQFAPTSHKIKALIYGAAGSGKTVFGGTAKDAIFASAEGGLLSIADKAPNYVNIKSLGDLKEFYAYMATKPHNFKTVIIDSITEINEIIKADIERKTGRNMQLQDWGVLAKEIAKILRMFRDLPLNVIFISQEVKEDAAEGELGKILPSLNGKAATNIAYFMDIVGYIFVDKNGDRKIITGSNQRLLTKDRSNKIGNEAPLDFEEWVKRISEIKVVEKENIVDTFTAEKEPAQNETIGEAVNKVKQPVKKSGYELAKEYLPKITNSKAAEEALARVSVMTEITAEQKSELLQLYSAKLAEFTAKTEKPAEKKVVKEPVKEPVEQSPLDNLETSDEEISDEELDVIM